MKNTRQFLFVILIIVFCQASFSQTTAMYYLNFPRSVSSVGLGEQGIVSRNSLDALAYNPANLIYAKNIQLSYFRNPFYSYGWDLPITSLNSSFQIPNIGYFGFEYLNWNLGRMAFTSVESPEGFEIYDAYQRSFSIGYAKDFSEEFAAGIQVRYAKDNFGLVESDKLLFSAGLNYNPDVIDKCLTVGFSLTNFGTAVEYNFQRITEEEVRQNDPPPSELKLGFSFLPIKNNNHQLAVHFQISKIFDERDANWQGQSSFKTLFTDWKDFPRDVTVHTGIAFKWLPLDLGNSFSFLQEFYLGNISSDKKVGLTNFYTHGAIVGIGYNGIYASIGYAEWWHNVHRSQYYYPQKLARETFQFTLGIDPNLIFRDTEVNRSIGNLNKIILSAGGSYTLRVRRSKEESFGFWGLRFKNSFSYSVESDFYIDENNALISSFAYQSVPVEYYYGFFMPFTYKTKIENIMFSSLYRYHPAEAFQPLFIQGGLGIIRANPVVLTYPKYDYRTYLTAGVGALVELSENIYLKPGLNFTSIFSEVSGAAPRLGSYNQFDVTIRVGYRIK